ncbi:hypothetical protein ACOSQ3_006852 [Xanthoceras sorbifolium]
MTRTNPTSNPDQQLSSRSVKWRPPDASAVKVNSDDAINSSNNLVGFGLVVRDHLGHVLGSSWQKVEASFSPLVAEASALLHVDVAEALAVLDGLTSATSKGWLPLLVECDALNVVNLSLGTTSPRLEIMNVIRDIRRLLL